MSDPGHLPWHPSLLDSADSNAIHFDVYIGEHVLLRMCDQAVLHGVKPLDDVLCISSYVVLPDSSRAKAQIKCSWTDVNHNSRTQFATLRHHAMLCNLALKNVCEVHVLSVQRGGASVVVRSS